MKTAIFIFVSFLSAFSFATDTQPQQEKWMCVASGRYSSGLPGGDYYQSVTGWGDTQLDAMSDAQQACFGMGLQFCMVQDCRIVEVNN